ncbi:CmpA/NrtA family ABC transporter substrate-binding protein [Glaciecola siphonariae]|uniref:CmpA/NrtA family ABC transporter substrate-binding protein n=1 Tax=Glaciecola siphonariae TaxID=521012 RepID=A0ABV9LUB5_9ALTE
MNLSLLSRPLNIGIVQLTDSAPLIMAKELGFFQRYGLDVNLQLQPSWSTLRDRLDAGVIDAAQLLAPMPFANHLGWMAAQNDIIVPMILSQNGNAVTLSNALIDEVKSCHQKEYIQYPLSARYLKAVIEKRKQYDLPPLRLASVFHFSCHRYQLLDWLAQAEITEKDIRLLVIPPAKLADSLQAGDIDGFCAGGPWNAKSVRLAQGHTALTSFDIWEDKLEKVLGLTRRFYHQHTDTIHALCAALLDTCEWLKDIPNRFEAARVLSKSDWLNESLDIIAPSLLGSCLTQVDTEPRHIPHYNRFSSLFSSTTESQYSVNRPTQEQAAWLLEKMLRYDAKKSHDKHSDSALAYSIFREDIFEKASDMRLSARTPKVHNK